MKIVIFLLAAVAFVSLTASAKTVIVTGPNVDPKTPYRQRIMSLEPGDTAVFQWTTKKFFKTELNEKKFVIDRFLGEGQVTRVYALRDQPGKALRVPSFDGYVQFEDHPAKMFLGLLVAGKQKLDNEGIPTVRLYDYVPSTFLVVDLVDGPTLYDFLTTPEKFNPIERQAMIKSLLEFARLTAAFDEIGDFKSDSLMYDKIQGWLLTDWTNQHFMANRRSHNNTFHKLYDMSDMEPYFLTTNSSGGYVDRKDPVGKWAGEIMSLIDNTIMSERGIRFNGSSLFCNFVLTHFGFKN